MNYKQAMEAIFKDYIKGEITYMDVLTLESLTR